MSSPETSRSGSDAVQMQTAVDEALRPTTPIRDIIQRYGIHSELSGASDQVVGGLIKTGGSLLERVFGYALAKRVRGGRPAGHYNGSFISTASRPLTPIIQAMKDRVLSKKTRLTVMRRSDNHGALINAQGTAPLEALAIFFACLCDHGGVEGGLVWVQEVLGASISAADTVYMRIHGLPILAEPRQTSPWTRSFPNIRTHSPSSSRRRQHRNWRPRPRLRPPRPSGRTHKFLHQPPRNMRSTTARQQRHPR
ncbi:hypothetical protein C8F04DRAFT_465167 [Mycena alexandri]|uniref:Uncharacterized protein n=1 Tax=Mycena alexandri TaxID=1745969 RepID=A0AAD6T0B3_9AGAR|nr:hypothetical protein C8F04DRAFT_465167 [Mycena alexandri]